MLCSKLLRPKISSCRRYFSFMYTYKDFRKFMKAGVSAEDYVNYESQKTVKNTAGDENRELINSMFYPDYEQDGRENYIGLLLEKYELREFHDQTDFNQYIERKHREKLKGKTNSELDPENTKTKVYITAEEENELFEKKSRRNVPATQRSKSKKAIKEDLLLQTKLEKQDFIKSELKRIQLNTELLQLFVQEKEFFNRELMLYLLRKFHYNIKEQEKIEASLRKQWEHRRNELQKMSPLLDIKFKAKFLNKDQVIKSGEFMDVIKWVETRLSWEFYSLAASCELAFAYVSFTKEPTILMQNYINNKLHMILANFNENEISKSNKTKENKPQHNDRWVIQDDLSSYLLYVRSMENAQYLPAINNEENRDNIVQISNCLNNSQLSKMTSKQAYLMYTILSYYKIEGNFYLNMEPYIIRDFAKFSIKDQINFLHCACSKDQDEYVTDNFRTLLILRISSQLDLQDWNDINKLLHIYLKSTYVTLQQKDMINLCLETSIAKNIINLSNFTTSVKSLLLNLSQYIAIKNENNIELFTKISQELMNAKDFIETNDFIEVFHKIALSGYYSSASSLAFKETILQICDSFRKKASQQTPLLGSSKKGDKPFVSQKISSRSYNLPTNQFWNLNMTHDMITNLSVDLRTNLENFFLFQDLVWSCFYFSLRVERQEHLDRGVLLQQINTLNSQISHLYKEKNTKVTINMSILKKLKQINAASQALGLNPKGSEKFLIDISKLFRSVNLNFDFNPKENLQNLVGKSQSLMELFYIENQIFTTIFEDYILEDNYKSIAEYYLSIEDKTILFVHNYSDLAEADENNFLRIVDSGTYIMDTLIQNSFDRPHIMLNPNKMYDFYNNQTEINELYIERVLKNRNLPPMKLVFLSDKSRNELKDLVNLWKAAFEKTFVNAKDKEKPTRIWSFETAFMSQESYEQSYETYHKDLVLQKIEDDEYLDSSDEDYNEPSN